MQDTSFNKFGSPVVFRQLSPQGTTAAPPPKNYRQLVTDFYMTHNPSKVGDVDAILESFRGNEELMMHALHEKYGVPQSATVASNNDNDATAESAAAANAPPTGTPPTATDTTATDDTTRGRAHTSVNVSWHHGPVTADVVDDAQDGPRHSTYPYGQGHQDPQDPIAHPQQQQNVADHQGGVNQQDPNEALRRNSEAVEAAHEQKDLSGSTTQPPSESQRSHAPHRKSVLDRITKQPQVEGNFTSVLVQQLSDQLQLLESRGNEISAFDPVSLSKLLVNPDQLGDAGGYNEFEVEEAQKKARRQMEEFIVAVTNFQHLTGGFVQLCRPIVDHLKEAEQKEQRNDAATNNRYRTHSPRQTQINRFLPQSQRSHYRSEGASMSPVRTTAELQDSMTQSFVAEANTTMKSDRRVIDVVPIDGEMNVVSDIIARQCGSGDIVMLHPGTYYENMLVGEGQHIEVRPAVEGPSGKVVILPCDSAVPVVQVNATGVLTIDGITLADSAAVITADKEHKQKAASNASNRRSHTIPAEELTTAQVPLLSCGGDSRVEIRNVALTGGNGGAFICHSASVSFTHCIFSRCLFAGIYSKDSSHVSLAHSSLLNCEVGLRIKHTSFALTNSQIRACTSNGIALHGTVKGVVENANITRCTGSAILLSPASEVLITASTIRNNGQYGIYAPSGADFVCTSADIGENGAGDYSRPPPLHTNITTTK